MATQAEIEANVARLEGGLSKVESGITFSDRGVTYRTVEDLQSAIAYWRRQMRNLLGRPRQTLVYGRKGF